MKLKTFQADTMAEALAQVKRRLGRDAVILHTRTYSTGGLFGWGARQQVEITAAKDLSDLPAFAERGSLRGSASRGSGPKKTDTHPDPGQADGAAPGMGSTQRTSQRTVADRLQPARSTTIPSTPDRDSAIGYERAASTDTSEDGLPPWSQLSAELGSIKQLVGDLVRHSRQEQLPALPEALFAEYRRLVEGQVADELAAELVARVRESLDEASLSDPEAVRQQAAAFIESMLPVAGQIGLRAGDGPTVVALVGPTGVGKTTTVAKLAANFKLRRQVDVGLITIDTYRIAAIEQLRTYAQIIDIPLEIVSTPAQVRAAMERLNRCKLVLVDTAGRSPQDPIRINELKCFLEQADPHEVHLVLSGTSSQQVLDDAVTRFADVGVNRVIFTKLDEAVGFGVILTSLQKAGAGLSYLTTGQNVPDDIEVGAASSVARWITAGRNSQDEAAHRAARAESDAQPQNRKRSRVNKGRKPPAQKSPPAVPSTVEGQTAATGND